MTTRYNHQQTIAVYCQNLSTVNNYDTLAYSLNQFSTNMQHKVHSACVIDVTSYVPGDAADNLAGISCGKPD